MSLAKAADKRAYKRAWRKKNKASCARSSKAWLVRNPEYKLLATAKRRAKKSGLAFNLRREDIVIPSHCPLLHIPLATGVAGSRKARKNAPSLDKIAPSRGYVRGNVWVVSWAANVMKHDATPAELVIFAKSILNCPQLVAGFSKRKKK